MLGVSEQGNTVLVQAIRNHQCSLLAAAHALAPASCWRPLHGFSHSPTCCMLRVRWSSSLVS